MDKLKPAVVIKPLEGYRGDAYHVRLSAPIYGKKRRDNPLSFDEVLTYEVVVSSINGMFGPETMVFPANEEGKPLSFVELVAIREYDHAAALAALGFEIVD